MTPGWDRPLYVLPFDHRYPYACEVFGFQERMTAEQTATATQIKRIIYDAFARSLDEGVPRDRAGVLIDEQFGSELLDDARQRGFCTIVPVERSGASEFQYDFGDRFAEHLERFSPTFAKVLVQYNPEGDAALNQRQLDRVKPVADFCRRKNMKFMFELIVRPEPAQLAKLGGDAATFDHELRPRLMVESIERIQDAGIEADVWKIEGLQQREDCVRVGQAVRRGGRERVGCVVLGRGENEDRVRHWLEMAASVPGFIGFAVGRSTFGPPLVAYRAGKLSAAEATAQIARGFRSWVEVFERAGTS
jgi:5-dehydro-2-deoxygluconokinase